MPQQSWVRHSTRLKLFQNVKHVFCYVAAHCNRLPIKMTSHGGYTVTVVFAIDLGSDALGKGDASNRCIQIKNTCSWSADVFCACEIIPLFSEAFCMVTAVCKFDFGLVVNETSNLERSCSEERLVFLTGSICFPRVSSCYGTLPTLRRPNVFSWVKDCSYEDNRHGVLL